jgi:hypothetical protein
MKTGRHLVPYVLLGVLTLGAGLGAGLGLSEGSTTDTATVASSSLSCQSSPTHSGFQVSCNDAALDANGYSSSITLWFAPHHGFSRKLAACVSAALDRTSVGSTDLEQEMATVARRCEIRGRL